MLNEICLVRGWHSLKSIPITLPSASRTTSYSTRHSQIEINENGAVVVTGADRRQLLSAILFVQNLSTTVTEVRLPHCLNNIVDIVKFV